MLIRVIVSLSLAAGLVTSSAAHASKFSHCATLVVGLSLGMFYQFSKEPSLENRLAARNDTLAHRAQGLPPANLLEEASPLIAVLQTPERFYLHPGIGIIHFPGIEPLGNPHATPIPDSKDAEKILGLGNYLFKIDKEGVLSAYNPAKRAWHASSTKPLTAVFALTNTIVGLDEEGNLHYACITRSTKIENPLYSSKSPPPTLRELKSNRRFGAIVLSISLQNEREIEAISEDGIPVTLPESVFRKLWGAEVNTDAPPQPQEPKIQNVPDDLRVSL